MKIGLVIYGSLDTLTGGFLYDKKLVSHFRSKGHEVKVFSLPWRNYPSHLLDNFRKDFVSSIHSANLDILIEDELNHPSLFRMNQKIKEKTNRPIITIVHHLRCSELRSRFMNNVYRHVESAYLSMIDGMIFNSNTTRKVVRSLDLRARPGVVAHPGRDEIRNGIDDDFIVRRSDSKGPLRVLFVGSVIPRKELHTLVEALSALPHQDWRLDIVGSFNTDRSYSRLIMKIINDKGIKDSVRILGPLDPKDLLSCYRENHVLAVPSSYEGFGIVYLEAMGFGLPSIASNVGAAHEIVTDRMNGFLVNPGDVAAIRDRLDSLNKDRTKLAKMGMAALHRYRVHPTWEQSAGKALEFVREMVS